MRARLLLFRHVLPVLLLSLGFVLLALAFTPMNTYWVEWLVYSVVALSVIFNHVKALVILRRKGDL